MRTFSDLIPPSGKKKSCMPRMPTLQKLNLAPHFRSPFTFSNVIKKKIFCGEHYYVFHSPPKQTMFLKYL